MIQEKLKIPSHNTVKHVDSKWLTLEIAARTLNEPLEEDIASYQGQYYRNSDTFCVLKCSNFLFP
ncbi:hypothetical protein PR048_011572 [Dryococelus australis]|uniref:Uncharacterized protein n=1 Tax=Dryococelus australis TaxID=614101 RepID=A0ABQ9HLX5_9NEOP|nr:hypothetical protein PR048_011572 [Dryococelus australis]